MTEAAGTTVDAEPTATEAAREEAPAIQPTGRYWLRVHGYPVDLKEDTVRYDEFFDPKSGPLPGDPRQNLQPGDTVIYYADGPASVYGVATVTGPPEGPLNGSQAEHWRVPIKAQAVILAINKAPHAAGLQPPSGWHFLRAARSYTFIRLPDEDGPYLVQQVKSRASTRATE
ncbi:MAG TPA: hypothetical protein VGK54_00995 [Chloroflexota bacterium]